MKTPTIFLVIAIAALGAIGITTAIMNTAITAHAVECHSGGKTTACPPGAGGFVIGPGGVHSIGPH